ncbi:MAG: hypothetical protein J1E43_01655 [Christensenellaceae bacterium]|nr:hypothetical protein [Christensenellaceae bacterium]
MKKRWLALMLAGMMFALPVLGMAEEPAAFDASRVAPLLDAVTSAALGADEATLSLTEEEALTEGFLLRLTKALGDNGLAADALSDLVAMPLPAQGANGEAAVKALSLQVLNADMSEDGDLVMLVGEVADAEGQLLGQRAVVELHREAASPVGWKVYRFVVGDTELEEALLESYFAKTMIEYINAACGYSIQYPAIFTEDLIVEMPSGIQAELPDGTASFSVTRMENVNGLNIDALLTEESQIAPGTQVVVDEVTGAGRSIAFDEEGFIHEAIFFVTEGYIYQAELNYPSDQAEDFMQYTDFMMNSFSADELGLG